MYLLCTYDFNDELAIGSILFGASENSACTSIGLRSIQEMTGTQWKPVTFFTDAKTPESVFKNIFGENISTILCNWHFRTLDLPRNIKGYLNFFLKSFEY